MRISNSEVGGALLPIVIAMSFVAAVVYSLQANLLASTREYFARGPVSQRAILELQIRHQVRVGPTMYASIAPSMLPQNQALYNCLINWTGDSPTDCAVGAWTPAALMLPDGTRISGSSPATMQMYNAANGICNVGSEPCVFGVWTEFSPTCPGTAPSCPVAAALYFNIHIVPIASSMTGKTALSEYIATQLVPCEYGPYGPASTIGLDISQLPSPTPVPGPPGPTVPVASGPPPPPGPTPTPPPPIYSRSCAAGQMTMRGRCVSYAQ